MPLTRSRSVNIEVTIARKIRPAIRLYSIAVAPDSSATSLLKPADMVQSLFRRPNIEPSKVKKSWNGMLPFFLQMRSCLGRLLAVAYAPGAAWRGNVVSSRFRLNAIYSIVAKGSQEDAHAHESSSRRQASDRCAASRLHVGGAFLYLARDLRSRSRCDLRAALDLRRARGGG